MTRAFLEENRERQIFPTENRCRLSARGGFVRGGTTFYIYTRKNGTMQFSQEKL